MIRQKNIMIFALAVSVLLIAGCSTTDNQGTPEQGNDLTGNVVASVNGEDITSDEVSQIQDNFKQQGQQVSEEDALQQLIDQKVLYLKAKEEGLTVSTEKTEAELERMLSQQGLTLENYKQQIETQGISYEDTVQDFREQLSAQEYLDAVLDQDFNITEEEVNAYYEQVKQQAQQEVPPLDEIEEQLNATLKQQKRQQARNALVQKIKPEFNIEK